MVSFADLRRAKESGLNLTSLLVRTYIAENGFTPIGLIADACGMCVRSVERALVALKAKGLLETQTTKESHDHVKHLNQRNRTTTVPSDDRVAEPAVAPLAKPEDPLAESLLAQGVLPWCVEIVLARVDRAAIERQLAWHEHRLANGFVFKGHPAKFLFRACLNDYAAPHDLQGPTSRRRAPAERCHDPKEVRTERAAPPPMPAEAPVALTRKGAMTVIRMGLRSKLPRMRAEALRLAGEWGVDAREGATG